MDRPLPPSQGNVNEGEGNVAVVIVLLVLAVTVVASRTFVRIFITKKFRWDDWTILFALFGTAIGSGLDFVEVHYGFGRPEAYLTPPQIQEFRKYSYGEWIQTFATLMWTKVSICVFLLYIPASKALVRQLQAAVVFLLVSNVVLTLLWIFQCHPIDAVWDMTVEGQCFSRNQNLMIILAQAVISVVSDFALASYPILILWRVQMKLKTKVGLCCLMSLGILTGMCCIVRTVLNSASLPEDMTFGGIKNWYWRSFEVNVGIIAACIPTLRPGYRWLSNKLSRNDRPSGEHWRLVKVPSPEPMFGNLKMNIERPCISYHPKQHLALKEDAAGDDYDISRYQIRKTTEVDIERYAPGD